jgi:acetyl esterase/lipase
VSDVYGAIATAGGALVPPCRRSADPVWSDAPVVMHMHGGGFVHRHPEQDLHLDTLAAKGRELADTLRAAGVPVEFHQYDDADHDVYAGRQVLELIDKIVAFFDDRLHERKRQYSVLPGQPADQNRARVAVAGSSEPSSVAHRSAAAPSTPA